jgi:hypothetical protein
VVPRVEERCVDHPRTRKVGVSATLGMNACSLRAALRFNDTLFGSDTSFSNFDNSLQGDAGNDDLHAGGVGSSLNGGSGSAVQQRGRRSDGSEFGFDLDNAHRLPPTYLSSRAVALGSTGTGLLPS